MKLQLEIFLAFFRVGIFGYGGGPASIPLVYKEVVDRYKWLDADEFGDIIALGNTLPGPIITKLAGYIGYRISGFPGMVNALVASNVPTILLMILLMKSISSIKQFDWVGGMIAAVVPVVGMMMAALTWQFFSKAKQNLGWLKSIIFCALVFFLIHFVRIHPAFIIAALVVFAFTKKDARKETAESKEGTGT